LKAKQKDDSKYNLNLVYEMNKLLDIASARIRELEKEGK